MNKDTPPALDTNVLVDIYKPLTDLEGDAEDLVDAGLFACICHQSGVYAPGPLVLTVESD